MTAIYNTTPLKAACVPAIIADGIPITTVILKAAVGFLDQVDSDTCIKPGIINYADKYTGKRKRPILEYENDLAPVKNRAEFYLAESYAYAPAGDPAAYWTVRASVGSCTKQLEVTGPRSWKRTRMGNWRLTQPEPVSDLKLSYENAFGGVWPLLDQHDDEVPNVLYEPTNPSGIGFISGSLRGEHQVSVPMIDYPASPTRAPGCGTRAGYGAISRAWAPRLGYAGTFDERWLKSRWPFWPNDFDPRFYNCAPIEQQINGFFVGNESIELVNITPSGRCSFRLPFSLNFEAVIATHDATEAKQCNLDTIVIVPEKLQAHLTWRVATRLQAPDWIVIRSLQREAASVFI